MCLLQKQIFWQLFSRFSRAVNFATPASPVKKSVHCDKKNRKGRLQKYEKSTDWSAQAQGQNLLTGFYVLVSSVDEDKWNDQIKA
jgi:hypothetical protein